MVSETLGPFNGDAKKHAHRRSVFQNQLFTHAHDVVIQAQQSSNTPPTIENSTRARLAAYRARLTATTTAVPDSLEIKPVTEALDDTAARTPRVQSFLGKRQTTTEPAAYTPGSSVPDVIHDPLTMPKKPRLRHP